MKALWHKVYTFLAVALHIHEQDAVSVRAFLPNLLRSIGAFTIAAIVVIAFKADFLSTAVDWVFVATNALLLFAVIRLHRWHPEKWLSLRVNVLIAALVVYVTLATSTGLLFGDKGWLFYGLPIAIAAFLLSPEAAWIWAHIALLAMVVRFILLPVPEPLATLFATGVFLEVITTFFWAVARSRRRLARGLRRQINQGQTGFEIGRMVTAAVEPDIIMAHAVQMIQSTFDYDNVAIFVLKPDGETLEFADAAGKNVEALKAAHARFAVSNARVVAVAVRQRQQAVVSTWEKTYDDRKREIEFTHRQLHNRIEMALPLQVGDRILGALDVQRMTLEPFSELDLHILEGLAGNIANALDVTLLLEERELANKALEQAYAEIHILNERLKEDNLRMTAELSVTRRLQKMLLPTAGELRQVENLDIAAFMDPAEEIGGDYYDVLRHNGWVKIAIGDVTGHGLESGVVMLMAQTAVRTLLTCGVTDPVRFMELLNQILHANIRRMQVDRSLTLSVLDYEHRETDGVHNTLKVSGQHENVLVMRHDADVAVLDTIDLGFPLGIETGIGRFVNEHIIHLSPGDGVVLYSDGITEAENAAGEFYGLERLRTVVGDHWAEPAEAVKDAVIADVRSFIDAYTVYDDLTLVVVKQQ